MPNSVWLSTNRPPRKSNRGSQGFSERRFCNPKAASKMFAAGVELYSRLSRSTPNEPRLYSNQSPPDPLIWMYRLMQKTLSNATSVATNCSEFLRPLPWGPYLSIRTRVMFLTSVVRGSTSAAGRLSIFGIAVQNHSCTERAVRFWRVEKPEVSRPPLDVVCIPKFEMLSPPVWALDHCEPDVNTSNLRLEPTARAHSTFLATSSPTARHPHD